MAPNVTVRVDLLRHPVTRLIGEENGLSPQRPPRYDVHDTLFIDRDVRAVADAVGRHRRTNPVTRRVGGVVQTRSAELVPVRVGNMGVSRCIESDRGQHPPLVPTAVVDGLDGDLTLGNASDSEFTIYFAWIIVAKSHPDRAISI